MTIADRVVALYGEPGLKRSALGIRGGAGVFEKVLAGKGYRHVLEIGTYRGVSAAEIAQYVERVTTIDLRYGRLEQLGTPFDREAMWKELGITNINLRLVDSDDEKKWIVDRLDFDFAFVDGGHQTPAIKFDFELVKRCGRVLFHDYERRGVPGQDDVCDFVDSLPKEQVQIMDIFALWTAR